MRGRAFERALEGLVEWWAAEWDVDWRAGIRYRSWAEGEVLGQALAAERADLDKTLNPPAPADRKGKGRASGSGRPPSKSDQKKLLAALGEAHGGEFRRSHKSLQRKAIGQYGSRDLSAVLFVCLCRALGLGARLVVSLQPVGWRMGDAGGASGAAKDRKGKGKAKATDSDGDDDDDVEMEPVPLPPPPAAPPQPQPTTSSSTAPAPGGFVRWIDRLPSQRVPGLRSTLGAQLGGFGSGSPGGQRLGGGAGQVGVGNPATGAGVKPKGQGRGHKLGEKNKDPNGASLATSSLPRALASLLALTRRLAKRPPRPSPARQHRSTRPTRPSSGPRSGRVRTRSGCRSTRSGRSSAGRRALSQRARARGRATGWCTCSGWRRVRPSSSAADPAGSPRRR